MAVSATWAQTPTSIVCLCVYFDPPFLFSVIKLLHEACLKTNCVLSDEEKENCYIYNQLYSFWGVGGTRDVLILDSV